MLPRRFQLFIVWNKKEFRHGAGVSRIERKLSNSKAPSRESSDSKRHVPRKFKKSALSSFFYFLLAAIGSSAVRTKNSWPLIPIVCFSWNLAVSLNEARRRVQGCHELEKIAHCQNMKASWRGNSLHQRKGRIVTKWRGKPSGSESST